MSPARARRPAADHPLCGAPLALDPAALPAASGGRLEVQCVLDPHKIGGQHCWRHAGIVILWGRP